MTKKLGAPASKSMGIGTQVGPAIFQKESQISEPQIQSLSWRKMPQ